MRGYWFAKGVPLRVQKLISQARIIESTLSGLEAFILNGGDLQKLDRVVFSHARELIGVKASGKHLLLNGHYKHWSLSNMEIYKAIGFVPCKLELTIRRLRWYQAISTDVDTNRIVTAGMFGQMSFKPLPTFNEHFQILTDENNSTDHVNPLAKLFFTDIDTMHHIDDVYQLIEDCAGAYPKIFTQAELAEYFQNTDVIALRSWQLHNPSGGLHFTTRER